MARRRRPSAPQDRSGRGEDQPRAHDARLRDQRRSRSGHVRPHRAVRHHRQGGHVAPFRGRRRDDATGRRRDRGPGGGSVRRWRGPRCRPRRCGVAHVVDRRRPGAVQPGRGRGHGGSLLVEHHAVRRHEPSVAGAPRRGRRQRAGVDHRAEARLDAGQGPPRRRRVGGAVDAARCRPRDGVRGSRVPEPQRVLVGRHRHLHAVWRAMHPGLRVLPRRHVQAAAARRRRAGEGGSGGGRHGTAVRRSHDGRPRRPRGRRRGPRCGHHRRDPRAGLRSVAGAVGGGAHQ